MNALIDLTGKRFGKLVVFGRDHSGKNEARWFCKCDCGKEVSRIGGTLRGGGSFSCGCNITQRQPIPVSDRFWDKVVKTEGCWLWNGNREVRAQVWIRERGTMVEAARIAWGLVKGRIPKGKCVLHTCDVPGCVNLDHLYIGTKLDNAIDRKVRKRHWKDRDPEGFAKHQRRISKLGNEASKRGRELCP